MIQQVTTLSQDALNSNRKKASPIARMRKPPVTSMARSTGGLVWELAGDDVLSHRVSPAVPSARRGLTTVFGMGTGVALAPLPPADQRSTGWEEEEGRACCVCVAVSRCVLLSQMGLAKPPGRLVRLGSSGCPPCTCRLSTSSSRTALRGSCDPGALVLGGASRLDAFSGSPVPT